MNLMQEAQNPPCGLYADGNYICRCHICENPFVGDKRAITCPSCAYRADERAKVEQEIASAIRNYDPTGFVCPECGSQHFGTYFEDGVGLDWATAVRCCHDEHGTGCRFRGGPGQHYPDPIFERLALFIELGKYKKKL